MEIHISELWLINYLTWDSSSQVFNLHAKEPNIYFFVLMFRIPKTCVFAHARFFKSTFKIANIFQQFFRSQLKHFEFIEPKLTLLFSKPYFLKTFTPKQSGKFLNQEVFLRNLDNLSCDIPWGWLQNQCGDRWSPDWCLNTKITRLFFFSTTWQSFEHAYFTLVIQFLLVLFWIFWLKFKKYR